MKFQASKKRQRKINQPIGIGTPIIPSGAVVENYEGALNQLIDPMFEDYRAFIPKIFNEKAPSILTQAMDASYPSTLIDQLNRLKIRWQQFFEKKAKQLAQDFTHNVNDHCTISVVHSLKTIGIKAPRATYTETIHQIVTDSNFENETLIASIPEEAHTRILKALFQSFNSNKEAKHGQPAMMNAVLEVHGMTKRRAKRIALDQTKKMYSALALDRMKENGVSSFKWVETWRAKEPRPEHVKRNGKLYQLNDPRLWDCAPADAGPPGVAINCHCIMIPVLTLD